MSMNPLRVKVLAALLVAAAAAGYVQGQEAAKKQQPLLYVVEPGIRNYVQYGGAGILVFDADHGHKFVKRIATPASQVKSPENIKGVCACAATKKLYFTTLTTLYCV